MGNVAVGGLLLLLVGAIGLAFYFWRKYRFTETEVLAAVAAVDRLVEHLDSAYFAAELRTREIRRKFEIAQAKAAVDHKQALDALREAIAKTKTVANETPSKPTPKPIPSLRKP